MRSFNKIFCIGLNKTGTTSLHQALKILGLNSVHYELKNGRIIKDLMEENAEAGRKLLTGMENFDAYLDWNHPHTNELFKTLDKQYPNSLFILTLREQNSWIQSRKRHVQGTSNLKRLQKEQPQNLWLQMDLNAWINEFTEHHQSVEAYFAGREDFLAMNIIEGDGWEKLCSFLRVTKPGVPFPWANKSALETVWNKIRKVLGSMISSGTN